MEKVVVHNLMEFLNSIFEYKKNEERNKTLFLRGQANSEWSLSPSLYRENLQYYESEMIYAAFQRAPYLQKNADTLFEKLTIFQHYGLNTRLLDLTLNPLIALYFACQLHEESIPQNDNSINIESAESLAIVKKTDGAVYCRLTDGVNFASNEVNWILSILDIENPNKDYMEADIRAEIAMHRIKILPDSFLSEDQKKYRGYYEYLLSVLEQNYFVIPNFNNERISLQNGAFLLTGYEILKNENHPNLSLIKPRIRNLNDEFDKIYIIPSQYKKEILEELEILNINESTLFPELEHHMNYIKSKKHTEIKNHNLNTQFYHEPLVSFYDWRIETKWKDLCTKKPEQITSQNHDMAIINFEESIESTLCRDLDPLADSKKYAKIITMILIEGIKKDGWYSDEKSLIQLDKSIQQSLDGCGYSTKIIQQKSNHILRLSIAEYAYHILKQFT